MTYTESLNYMMLELHVPDFEKIKTFYSTLGFKTAWERAPDGFKGYLVLQMEDNILCFWCGSEDVEKHPYFKNFPQSSALGKGVEVVLTTKYLDELYEKLKGNDCVIEPMEKKPWGLRDFRIKDPYGYYLRITSPHDILSNEWAVP